MKRGALTVNAAGPVLDDETADTLEYCVLRRRRTGRGRESRPSPRDVGSTKYVRR
jgi:hypothetical protein